MTADALGPVDRSHDAEIIRDLRAQRAKLDERETTEAWSLRLTFGEIDALLRAVDDRDAAVRRLVGEWEGDIPDPLPAVEVAPYVGELGERPDDADPGTPTCGRISRLTGTEQDHCGRGMSCANLTRRPWTSAGCPDA